MTLHFSHRLALESIGSVFKILEMPQAGHSNCSVILCPCQLVQVCFCNKSKTMLSNLQFFCPLNCRVLLLTFISSLRKRRVGVLVPPCQEQAFTRSFGDLSRTEIVKSKITKSCFKLVFLPRSAQGTGLVWVTQVSAPTQRGDALTATPIQIISGKTESFPYKKSYCYPLNQIHSNFKHRLKNIVDLLNCVSEDTDFNCRMILVMHKIVIPSL